MNSWIEMIRESKMNPNEFVDWRGMPTHLCYFHFATLSGQHKKKITFASVEAAGLRILSKVRAQHETETGCSTPPISVAIQPTMITWQFDN